MAAPTGAPTMAPTGPAMRYPSCAPCTNPPGAPWACAVSGSAMAATATIPAYNIRDFTRHPLCVVEGAPETCEAGRLHDDGVVGGGYRRGVTVACVTRATETSPRELRDCEMVKTSAGSDHPLRSRFACSMICRVQV